MALGASSESSNTALGNNDTFRGQQNSVITMRYRLNVQCSIDGLCLMYGLWRCAEEGVMRKWS